MIKKIFHVVLVFNLLLGSNFSHAMLASRLTPKVVGSRLANLRRSTIATAALNRFAKVHLASNSSSRIVNCMEFVKQSRPLLKGLSPVVPKKLSGVYADKKLDITTRSKLQRAVNKILRIMPQDQRAPIRQDIYMLINENIYDAMRLHKLLPYEQVLKICIARLGVKKGTVVAYEAKQIMASSYASMPEGTAEEPETEIVKNDEKVVDVKHDDQTIDALWSDVNMPDQSKFMSDPVEAISIPSIPKSKMVIGDSGASEKSSYARSSANVQSKNVLNGDQIISTSVGNKCSECSQGCKNNVSSKSISNTQLPQQSRLECPNSQSCMTTLMNIPGKILAGMVMLLGLEALFISSK